MRKASPSLTARTAGFFWLMTIVTGTFSLVSSRLVDFGDAAATATNILAHEPSFRLGIAANLMASVCYLVASVLVYALLKPVNRNVSLLAAFFSLVGCAVSGLSFLLNLSPLVVLGDFPYLSAFTLEQRQAQALTFLRLNGLAFSVGHVFFGLHCLLVGCLILRSTYLPRILGALMAFAGLGWLTMSFANLLSPPLARSLSPYVMLPGILGEASLTLWLVVMGVNVRRFEEQSGECG